jgi:hypothetical protein
VLIEWRISIVKTGSPSRGEEETLMPILKSTNLMIVGMVVLFAVGILVSPSYAGIDPRTIAGMWLFDEGEGDTAPDSSGNGNDGKLTNGPEWDDGKFGDALQFDGTDDYVDVGNADNLSITGDFSFSMWVYISEYPTGWSNMLSKLANDQNAEFNFRYKNSTTAQFYFGTGAAAIICNWNPSEDLPLDEWTHIAGVRKSKTYLKLYFNGVEKRSANISTDAISTEASVTIGRQSDAKFYFNGIIDEVAIFNAALEVEDIQTLMNKGLEEVISAVEFSGKLTATWASIKAQN